MRNKMLFIFLLLTSMTYGMEHKRVKELKREHLTPYEKEVDRIIDLQEFARMREQYEKRRSRELEIRNERARANALTRCIDFSKVIATIISSLIGIILSSTR